MFIFRIKSMFRIFSNIYFAVSRNMEKSLLPVVLMYAKNILDLLWAARYTNCWRQPLGWPSPWMNLPPSVLRCNSVWWFCPDSVFCRENEIIGSWELEGNNFTNLTTWSWTCITHIYGQRKVLPLQDSVSVLELDSKDSVNCGSIFIFYCTSPYNAPNLFLIYWFM